MIIDTFRPDPTGPDHIYKRWRDVEGNLKIEIVDDYEPYFWIKASTSKSVIERILNRYPGSYIDENDTAQGLKTNEKLIKVYAYRQSEIKDMATEFGQTWEADLSLVDRYLIDNVSEMPEWKPRVWHFDLEWDPKTDETTVMAVVDSYNNRKIAFCWKKDNPTNQAFLNYMEECNPDVFIAHAIMWADLPHLVRRMKQFRKLSPLGRVMRPDKNGSYKSVAQPIVGRLCFDTAASYDSGSGFERVWKDSGQPQLKNLKLDTIAKACKLGGKFEMDVHTGWTKRFDDYVDYCMQDTVLLKKIDENNHVLNFFMSLQRLCGVAFASSHNVTRFARGLLSRRTHWKAPSKSNQVKQEYEGAFIPPPTPGRYEGVACVDYKGLYPSIILSHCLSWETQVPKHMANDEGVRQLPDGTCWRQDPNALLPTIVNEMFDLRALYKSNMRKATSELERNGWNTMQLAVKRAMASLYGMVASNAWGWCDYDIASAITSCGRAAIKALMEESEAAGYKALYGHTDSAFVQVPFDEAADLAKHLTETIQRTQQASHLIVEFEAYMPYWIVGGKNLYYGICSYPPEDVGKKKSARWGKISTLAPVSKDLENDVLTAICSGANEQEVIDMVRPISNRIKRGEIGLSEIATNTRLQKSLNAYSGDSVLWVYVNSSPHELPNTKVVGYRNESEIEGFGIDYDTLIDRLIKRKLQNIFKAMKWDLGMAAGEKQPKNYGW